VTPDGGAEQTLATTYAFRTEQQTVPRLDTWVLRSWSGSHTDSNFTLEGGTWEIASWTGTPLCTSKEDRPMQQARTEYQRMVSGARRLLVAMRRRVGVLAGVLAGLLPLHVGAVGTGDIDPSFGGDGMVFTDCGRGNLPADRLFAV
jgi:hypothetical protein